MRETIVMRAERRTGSIPTTNMMRQTSLTRIGFIFFAMILGTVLVWGEEWGRQTSPSSDSSGQKYSGLSKPPVDVFTAPPPPPVSGVRHDFQSSFYDPKSQRFQDINHAAPDPALQNLPPLPVMGSSLKK